MSILLKQAKLISPQSPLNGKVMDILIEGGKIIEIKKSIFTKSNH